MKRTTLVLAALAVGGALIVWQRDAGSQLQVAPSYVPIGVAANEAATTAWFHHPASGRIVVCQAVARQGSAPQCAEGRLP